MAFLAGVAGVGVAAVHTLLHKLGPVAKEIARLPLVKIAEAPENKD